MNTVRGDLESTGYLVALYGLLGGKLKEAIAAILSGK